MARRPPILAALLILATIGGWVALQLAPAPIPKLAGDAKPDPPAGFDFAAFEDLLLESSTDETSPAATQQLVEMAERRSGHMQRLISTDPEQALARAISWTAYERAPEAIKPYLERPFNELASLHALPVCGVAAPGAPDLVYDLELTTATFHAHPVGAARTIGSKEASPLSGITLDGLAAVRELPLELISAIDRPTVAARPLANPHPDHCLATGAELGEAKAEALIGGHRALFADATTALEFGRRLRELDEAPGPHSGSRVVFELADGEPSEAFDWQAAGELVENEADTWTETPKNVVFIRVDFPDLTGEATSQATLAASLATTSASIQEQSYGKTSLNVTVSAATLRLPNPTTSYLPNKTSDIHNAAKAAYEATYGAGSLSTFDIIGVHFADIDMASSSGFNFAGLAGGTRQWLQGTTNPNVIIHEFGHNYGIGHASFWDTSDGSVVGNGANSEYGDIFDIMGSGPDPEGHFHMQAKERLDWIDSTQWVDADTAGSGTYRIYRIDDQDTTGSYRGIRAQKGSSPDEYYWIGYRAGIPGNAALENGAYLIWQRPGLTRSWLLDTTPDSPGGKDDAALAIGTTYSDTSAGVHFTPVAKGGSGADAWLDINVQLGAFPGNSDPTASISGPTTADARNPIVFTASTTDTDGDPLAYSWDFGDGALSPNSSSVTKTWVTGGTYTIELTVSDMKGGIATDSLTVTVADPLNTWTQRTSGVTADLHDIATDGTQLIAVGDSAGTYIASTDGASWSGGTLGINIRLRGLIYDGTQWVAAGYDYDFSINEFVGVIYTSPDGATWTNQFEEGERLRDTAAGNGVLIAVGDAGTLRRSTDGVTWTQIATGVAEDLEGVSYGNGTFTAVGSGPGGGPAAVLTSIDGLSWTDRSSGAGTDSWQGFYDVEFLNGRFFASGWYSKIRHSTDGGQTFSTNLSDTHQIPAFAYGNDVYLAAGIDKSSSDADIDLISTDGENWTTLVTADQEPRNGALFFNNTFVTVGNAGSIWQSAPFGTLPSFAAWLAANFPGGSDAESDPDGDGVSNLGEYATGTDPNDPTDVARPTETYDGSFLTLTVAKDPTATDVTYTIEYSTDLVGWSTAGTTVITDTATELVVRVDASAERGFLRALFSTP